jgi:hypothetical protein
MWRGNTFIIFGLREKRSAVAGRIIELRGEAEQLETDLFHIDAVLRMYEVDPADITTKGRVPNRSAYFARNEITKRIYEALRTQETVSAGRSPPRPCGTRAWTRKPTRGCAPTLPSGSSRPCTTCARLGRWSALALGRGDVEASASRNIKTRGIVRLV